MKLLIPVIVLMTFVLTQPPLQGRIYTKVHPDGTIEYYNRPVKSTTPVKTRKVNLISTYDQIIKKYAAKEGIDPQLIRCLIKVESDFNADAVSVAGAMGLMQLMQSTAGYYDVKDPLDPDENIRVGTRHLKQLLDYFKGNVPLALAAYHAGLGRVKKRMAVPPIKSTIDYVNKVMFLYTGKKHHDTVVKRLYQRIEKDGTIVIYSK